MNKAALRSGGNEQTLILIVDDDPQNIQVLANMLSKHQYQIAFSMDGTQAVDKVKEILPDLILLDVVMPQVNGYEVCRRLKSCPETASIPVIFLTAKTGKQDIVDGFAAGAVDYITKPFNSVELLARVNTHFELKAIRDRQEKLIADQKKTMAELQRVNEAVRASEEKYRSIYETAPLAIVVWDLNCRIIDWNHQAETIFGWTREEILGKNFFDCIIPKENKPRLMEVVDAMLKGRITHGINSNMTKSGNLIYCQWSNSILHDPNGNAKAIISLALDITGRKNTEQERDKLTHELAQSEKMKAIGTLAGGLAHNFNNLLMGIQGRTSLILYETDMKKSQFEHLKSIEEYVRQATELTRQLLGFARGTKCQVKPSDLNSVIQKSVRLFGRMRKEITINEEYDSHLSCAEIDQSQIEQVLLNILVNAWQAMPNGGQIYIKTENRTIVKSEAAQFNVSPGRYAQVSITDTGIGMDSQTLNRIFDPFFTSKQFGQGTGLGLSSAYGIIKNHGGSIWAYSEKGCGSTFTFYLPASDKQALEVRKSDSAIVKGSETILLVDDEQMIIDVASHLLQALNYSVLTADSGPKAISIYQADSKNIDLILLDIIMPGMTAAHVCESLIKINPNVKILVASGYSETYQAKDLLNMGCKGFIQKPFDLKGLSQKIRAILDV